MQHPESGGFAIWEVVVPLPALQVILNIIATILLHLHTKPANQVPLFD